jgi:hypothetical protein
MAYGKSAQTERAACLELRESRQAAIRKGLLNGMQASGFSPWIRAMVSATAIPEHELHKQASGPERKVGVDLSVADRRSNPDSALPIFDPRMHLKRKIGT